ncbi:MAG TPA: LCP family protein, partial [Candidatus Limnocylindrales bacterium]|nr:LCP family protein [Candidatus Limnocylindrales bacterium]
MFKKNQPSSYEYRNEALRAEAAYFPPLGTTLPPYTGGYASPALQPVVSAPPKRSMKQLFKRAFITLMVVALLGGGYIGAKFLINASKALSGSLFGLLQNDELKGEAEGRVNILLAGNSADDPGHGGANLTDSIMLVSVDTRNKTAFMLSIPRDLYVEVPNRDQYSKINAIYEYGREDEFSEAGYPEGGMGALAKVVSTNFGIPVHYYALVNYSAFRDSVNAVGGIDVTIQSEDPRGLYDAMISRA